MARAAGGVRLAALVLLFGAVVTQRPLTPIDGAILWSAPLGWSNAPPYGAGTTVGDVAVDSTVGAVSAPLSFPCVPRFKTTGCMPPERTEAMNDGICSIRRA